MAYCCNAFWRSDSRGHPRAPDRRLRARRKAYGDPELVGLAADHPHLRERATVHPPAGALEWMSRVAGVFALLGLGVGAAAAYKSTAITS
jgi:hypothetical protein